MSYLNRITLNNLIDALKVYAEKYGEYELMTIGVSSESNFTFLVGKDDVLSDSTLKLPVAQYTDKYEKEFKNYSNF